MDSRTGLDPENFQKNTWQMKCVLNKGNKSAPHNIYMCIYCVIFELLNCYMMYE